MAIKAVTVTTASTVVLDPEPNRVKVVICNNSDTDMYLAPGEVALTTYGIPLRKNGGAWVDEPDPQGYIYKGMYTAICTASKVLSVAELTR